MHLYRYDYWHVFRQDLEADRALDMQLLQEAQDEEDMQAFCERWSVDSDGNWPEPGQRSSVSQMIPDFDR